MWRIVVIERGGKSMKQEYKEYLRKLGIIGDWFIRISGKFKLITSDNMRNTEELKIFQQIFMSGIEEMKQCRLILIDIVPPDISRKEHQKIILGIQTVIEGIEKMYNSLDTIDYKIDNINIDMYNEGDNLHKKGLDLVVKSTQEITRKLGEESN